MSREFGKAVEPAAKSYEELFQALSEIQSEIELANFLRELTARFGFSAFMIVMVPAATDDRLQPQIRLSNAPSGFLSGYDRLGLLRGSRLFAALRGSTVPQVWEMDHLESDRSPAEAEMARDLFRAYDVTMGVFFPVHDAAGGRAAIGFHGNRPALSTTETSELGLLVIHAYDIYNGLRRPDRTARQGLTARELEVLTWVANGKTSSEIAAILSLSDHTINTYMNTAMRKLDCVNRTQLVAKAMRLRLIS